MMTVIKNNKGPISASEIDNLEQRLSIKLPAKYRDFLEEYNGGYPEPDGFLFKDESDGSSVDRFFGLHLGMHHNLEKYLDTYAGRIPKNLFPIARDPGGNLVVIGLSGDEKNKIYFWDHEREADGYEPDMSNVHLVANGFDEFLGLLYEIDIN